MNSSAENAAPVQAVTVSLPTWWPDQPEVWFARVEAVFRQRKITADSTKFDYVLAALDNEAAVRILDIIRAPPVNTSYQSVKDRLVGSLALTEFERACKIIHGIELGDEKPSTLMARMMALYDENNPHFLFRAIFLLKMPEFIREHLHEDVEGDLHTLAMRADHQWALRKSSVSVTTVSSPTEDNVSAIRHGTLQKKNKKKNVTPPSSYCFYHAKFGSRAEKCRAPCTFPTNDANRSGNELADRQ